MHLVGSDAEFISETDCCAQEADEGLLCLELLGVTSGIQGEAKQIENQRMIQVLDFSAHLSQVSALSLQ